MIAGPSPGVGKSFVCSNLAVTIAQAGQRVLLIDADMRRGILDQFASLEGFASPANVNAITLSFDPALFGLRAYLFARDQGGRDFVARVISGDVDFATEEGGPMHP